MPPMLVRVSCFRLRPRHASAEDVASSLAGRRYSQAGYTQCLFWFRFCFAAAEAAAAVRVNTAAGWRRLVT